MMSAPPPHADARSPRSIEELADEVRRCRDRSARIRIAGAGTWLDAGRPPQAAVTVSTHALRGIVEYEPGDLTLTARAGTSLREIADATRAHGQFLALDPFGSESGTLGATLATGGCGPLSHAFGAPRDAALGVVFVTGDGTVVRGGGRVVKNVAGFDLVRLIVGSWGTLGIIAEATVRLRALPETQTSIALAIPTEPLALEQLLARARAASLAPWCAELVSGALAAACGLEERAVLLLRLAGNSASVRTQESVVRALGDAAVVADDVWDTLRTVETRTEIAAALRLSIRSSRVVQAWSAATRLLDRCGGSAHATIGRGVVRVLLSSPPTVPMELPSGVACIFERLPAERWTSVPPAADDPLSRMLRTRFDPAGILNPGILGS